MERERVRRFPARARDVFWFRQDGETWSSIRMTDSLVWRTRSRMRSYSMRISVLSSAWLATAWRKMLYSRE